jgi:hypothetical protein
MDTQHHAELSLALSPVAMRLSVRKNLCLTATSFREGGHTGRISWCALHGS